MVCCVYTLAPGMGVLKLFVMIFSIQRPVCMSSVIILLGGLLTQVLIKMSINEQVGVTEGSVDAELS